MGGGGVLRKYKSMKKMSLHGLCTSVLPSHEYKQSVLCTSAAKQGVHNLYKSTTLPCYKENVYKSTNLHTRSYPDPAYVCSLYSVQVYYTPVQ